MILAYRGEMMVKTFKDRAAFDAYVAANPDFQFTRTETIPELLARMCATKNPR